MDRNDARRPGRVNLPTSSHHLPFRYSVVVPLLPLRRNWVELFVALDHIYHLSFIVCASLESSTLDRVSVQLLIVLNSCLCAYC